MINIKIQHIRQAGNIIFLSVFLVLNFSRYAIAKDSAEISGMISGLFANLSIDYLTSIYNEIRNISDASAKSELKQELHQKLDEIFGVASIAQDADALNVESKPSTESLEALSSETKYMAIKLQIEALQLGPGASTEIIRSRDELAAEINNIADPDKREELLQLLETKEQD